MPVFVAFCTFQWMLIASIVLKILVVMLCLHQRIPGSHLVAVYIGDDTADVPFPAAGIGWNQPVDFTALKVLSLLRVSQRCVYHLSKTVMIVPLVPGIGQFALARRLYAEAGNITVVIVLIRAGHKSSFGVARLDDDLDLRVAHITANGTYAVCVKGMRALTREMTVLIAVNASVPVVCTVPIPCRGGSDAVTGLSGLGIAMLLGKMLVPIHIFYADPFAAVTSGEVGNVLTANEAEIAVVT